MNSRRDIGEIRLLVDKCSTVVVTTLLDNVPCLTFDEDFRSLGLTVIP
jgi:hypothetical protein